MAQLKHHKVAASKMSSYGKRRNNVGQLSSGRFQDAVVLAQEIGLMEGARTEYLRGRMPKALVEKAKARTGVQSDTELIEIALANLAVADEYPSWLLSQKGTVNRDLDLEF